MSMAEVLAVVFGIISIVGTFLTYYFQVKTTLMKNINGLISEEEDTKNIKQEKKDDVVNKLFDLVPIIFKPILNKTVLAKLVQFAFDKIEEYADKQKDIK